MIDDRFTRRGFGGLAIGAAVAPMPALAQEPDLYAAQMALVFNQEPEYLAALATIKQRGNPDMIAGLIQGLRFTRMPRAPLFETLEALVDDAPERDLNSWLLWQEAHPEIKPHDAYRYFKRDLFRALHPDFLDFLQLDYMKPERMKIRLEEIVWGGVIKDGIPSLDDPELVPASDPETVYLNDDDLVFGVSINGDARAYPLRIMGWHEMFNAVIGGVPVALAYCTLCGSGILFETQVNGRDKPLVFGSSGFLYRSNKLMFDRETHSLWNQFTGKPVMGPLVDEEIELKQRPVVITSWKAWKEANPDSLVVTLNTGHRRDYGAGVVYNDYFNSPDLMFPAIVDETHLKQKDYVFGVRAFGGAKAWPLDAFEAKPVINDRVGATEVVLFGDPTQRTVRAYERKGLKFSTKDGAILSGDGTTWTQSEEALVAGDRKLPRVAGHVAYWFAWNGYLADVSEVFGITD